MTEIFKKGDVVRCINDDGKSLLTVGKQYDVLSTLYNYWVEVINDKGDESIYHPELFELSYVIPDRKFPDEIPPASTCTLPPGTTGKTDLINKPHLAYFDPHLEHEMGIGMRKGATKHGWNNHWQLEAKSAQQILDSVKRHLNAYLRGQQIDPELGINHLACVVNNLNFLYRLDRQYGYDEVLDSIYGNTK